MSKPKPDSSIDYPRPLVSVVMPVHDQKCVLRQTLESICGQSFKNFELVLVDDGSIDESPAIEREFAARDPRIRLFPRTAQGAAPARNFGLGRTAGRYVIFLDSDDLFHPDLLLDMASVLEATGADICVCEADTFDDKGAVKPFVRFGCYKEGLYSRHAFGRQSFQIGAGCAWNKMYRRTFLVDTGIQFQDLKWSEDSAFSTITLRKARSVYLLKSKLVFYRRGLGTSIHDTRRKEHPLESLKAAEKVFDEAYDPHDLSPSETTSLRMRCAMLLIYAFENLIRTQSYDEASQERFINCLKRWGPLGTPHTRYELIIVMMAAAINHATCDKALWAFDRWRHKESNRTLPEKLDFAARIGIAIVASNLTKARR